MLIGRSPKYSATVKRCAKYLRAGCRGRRMIVPVLHKLFAGNVDGAFDAARAPVSDRVRDCLQWRMPVDSVNDDHLLGIGRPLRGKRISSRIKRLYDFLEWTKVFAGADLHKIQMEVVVA